MGIWTTVILEAYCMRGAEQSRYGSKWCYEHIGAKGDFSKGSWKKIKNPCYKKGFRARKPRWCPERPQYKCLEKNCRWFAYSDACKEEYIHDNRFWKKVK